MRAPLKQTRTASVPTATNPSGVETAAYIAEMCAELSKLAGAADLPMLGYFLNLARVEAQIYVRENDGQAARREF